MRDSRIEALERLVREWGRLDADSESRGGRRIIEEAHIHRLGAMQQLYRDAFREAQERAAS